MMRPTMAPAAAAAGTRRNTMTPLTTDQVRALARAAGLTIRDDEIGPLTERLNATRAQLAAVPEALLAGSEPAFVLPLPGGAS
jgi:hypothetical protein